MTLLELVVVVSLLGLLALAGITRFGFDTLGNGGAEGYARKLSLALLHARRATISTGDNHYLQLATSGGNVTSFTLMRRASGGDVQVDESRTVPTDVVATSAQTVLEFDFDGSSLAAYSVSVVGPDRSWNVAVTQLTGSVAVTETTP
jgi:type II secretory pathway pseudopilin PulG